MQFSLAQSKLMIGTCSQVQKNKRPKDGRCSNPQRLHSGGQTKLIPDTKYFVLPVAAHHLSPSTASRSFLPHCGWLPTVAGYQYNLPYYTPLADSS